MWYDLFIATLGTLAGICVAATLTGVGIFIYNKLHEENEEPIGFTT